MKAPRDAMRGPQTLPAAGPEPMPEGWSFDEDMQTFWRLANWLDPADLGVGISIDRMRKLLATQGLAIVPAADVPSAEERQVLEAFHNLDADTLECWRDNEGCGELTVLACAELARRAAKEGPLMAPPIRYPQDDVWRALLAARSINHAAQLLGMSTGALRKRVFDDPVLRQPAMACLKRGRNMKGWRAAKDRP